MEQALKYKEEGNKKFKAGQYQQAIQDYTNAISYAKNDATMYGNRSAAWMMLKAYKQCVEDCQTALSLDPKFTKIRQRLIKALIAQGEFLKAKINIKALLESNPDDKDAANDLALVEKLQIQTSEADAALDAKDFAKAKSLYIQIEQHAPGSDAIVLKEAQANIGLHNYAQVLRDCLQIIRHDPSNSDAYLTGQRLCIILKITTKLSVTYKNVCG
eukprot:Phypoly_transcript_04474.p1 GENE.Phypoly_transcript_04474~~Phypoly_transcript_04474.p1  ORF type:complete len:222 (+),score=42.48 Phypoly_transcript_04474:22-666(+)